MEKKLEENTPPPSFSPSWITLIDPSRFLNVPTLPTASLRSLHDLQCTSMSMALTWKECPLSGRGWTHIFFTHGSASLREALIFLASGTSRFREALSHWRNPCKLTFHIMTHCHSIIIFYKYHLSVMNIKTEFHMQDKDTATTLEWHLTFLN